MNKRILLTTVIALAVLGGIFGFRFYQLKQAKAAMGARKPIPATVTTASATEQWPTLLSAVGTLESFQGVAIRAEIEGRIVKIAFESGALVKAGDVLVEMDTATEAAQLKSYEASARLTESNLGRARDLQVSNTNTKSDLDLAEANAAQANANVEFTRATLAKKRIVAPFAGRLGLRQVNLGQFLNKGDLVVTLEAVDPIYADFSLPQQEITNLTAGLPVEVAIDAYAGRPFAGKIEAIDPRVDGTTRNIHLRATLANTDEALRPGMFARVNVVLPGDNAVVAVPATAIVYSPYGNSIYVAVEEKGALIAQQRFVTLGARRGDLIAITKGVAAGEDIVTTGQGKLRPGSPISVNNKVVPASSATPKPQES